MTTRDYNGTEFGEQITFMDLLYEDNKADGDQPQYRNPKLMGNVFRKIEDRFGNGDGKLSRTELVHALNEGQKNYHF